MFIYLFHQEFANHMNLLCPALLFASFMFSKAAIWFLKFQEMRIFLMAVLFFLGRYTLPAVSTSALPNEQTRTVPITISRTV